LDDLLDVSEADFTIYMKVAMIYCEVYPHRDQGPPGSERRKRYLRRKVPTLRQWRHRFIDYVRR
jgi:hypothetical protein